MRALMVAAAACLAFAGCAASVTAVPSHFNPLASGTSPREIALGTPTTIQLSTGYTRVLPAGSRWREAGTISEGAVYMPVGTIFTIEGRDVHEAYLVIRDGRLEGFYLVAEGRFSPLQPPIFINATGGKQ